MHEHEDDNQGNIAERKSHASYNLSTLVEYNLQPCLIKLKTTQGRQSEKQRRTSWSISLLTPPTPALIDPLSRGHVNFSFLGALSRDSYLADDTCVHGFQGSRRPARPSWIPSSPSCSNKLCKCTTRNTPHVSAEETAKRSISCASPWACIVAQPADGTAHDICCGGNIHNGVLHLPEASTFSSKSNRALNVTFELNDSRKIWTARYRDMVVQECVEVTKSQSQVCFPAE
jgi:hypothetical protein